MQRGSRGLSGRGCSVDGAGGRWARQYWEMNLLRSARAGWDGSVTCQGRETLRLVEKLRQMVDAAFACSSASEAESLVSSMFFTTL